MIRVVRSQPAPASLAAQKSYGAPDVLQALEQSFRGKCYLCESLAQRGTMDVDHRIQLNERPELRCDWTNLFPTCTTYRCNTRRTKTWPVGGLLDPTQDDVEARLLQLLAGLPSARLRDSDVVLTFCARDALDQAAGNTAEELDRIHNGTGSSANAKLTAKALLKNIERHITNEVVQRLMRLEGSQDAAEQAVLQDELSELCGADALYSALVRSYLASLQASR